jgi:ADP-ribose pyrophosphatase YjhB (NUDIX family)
MREQETQANRLPEHEEGTVSPDVSRPSSGKDRMRRLAIRLLHVWFRFSRGMTLGVRAMVVDGENRVLLVRHGYLPGWHFPGGGVEVGQTLVEALAAELLEETNIRLNGRPALHAIYLQRAVSRRDHIALFVVRAFERLGPRKPDREIAEIGFFPLDSLPEATTAATRRRIAEVLGGAPADSIW